MHPQAANGCAASIGGTADVAKLNLDKIKAELANFVRRGGPLPHEYPALQALMDTISTMRASGTINETQNNSLWESIGDVGTAKTLMGFIFRKPHGYHGDFEIIDKFYREAASSVPHLNRWDRWILSLDSTRAVLNRKAFFKSLIHEETRQSARLKLLNVGSGPCRDLRESLDGVFGAASVETTCIDLDPKAIEYAREVLGGHASSVTFLQQNILRLRHQSEFDVAWSAGLFDYLNDRLFVAALKKMYNAVKPGGNVVVGNFSSANPARSAMEWGNWKLNYRDSAELLRLATSAGIPKESVEVRSEPLGVNLFLHARRN